MNKNIKNLTNHRHRRCPANRVVAEWYALLAMSWTLLGLLFSAPACAVEVFGGGVFKAENANQWGAGQATVVDVGYNTDPLFLGFQFDTGHLGFDGIAGSEPFAFGLAFDAYFKGRVGLEVGYYLDTGSVDARYPFGFGYQYLDSQEITAKINNTPSWDRIIDFNPSFSQSGNAYLTTNFPEVGAYAQAVVELQSSAQVEGCVFGCVDFNLIPGALRNIDYTQELVSFNGPDAAGQPDNQLRIMGLSDTAFSKDLELENPSQANQSGKLAGGVGVVVDVSNVGFNQPITVSAGLGVGPVSVTRELAEMTLRMPENLDMAVTNTAPSSVPTALTATGSDQMLEMKLDMTSLASAVVPYVPLGTTTLSAGPASLELTLFDYKLGPSLGLSQTVSLAPEPTLTLAFDQDINVRKNGQEMRTDHVDALLGKDTLAIQFPNREINITPSFSLNPKFSNDLDLNLALSQKLEALGLGVDFAGLGGFKMGPFITDERELATTKLADLVATRFDLSGTIENPVSLQLQPITLAEGLQLPGESPDAPRYATTVQDSTYEYQFRFDSTDLGVGKQDVWVNYFGSGEDSHSSYDYSSVWKCNDWFIICWSSTESSSTTIDAIYASHQEDGQSRTIDVGSTTFNVVNPSSADQLSNLPDQTPLAVTERGAGLATPALPAKFQDSDPPPVVSDLLVIKTITDTAAKKSDLVQTVASERYEGYGMTDSVYVASPLIQTRQDGNESVFRFADSLDFLVTNLPTFSAQTTDKTTGQSKTLDFQSYEFESLTLPHDRLDSLLAAIGDTDGIDLQVANGSGGWDTLEHWLPNSGNDLRHNFFDDYLRQQLGGATVGVNPEGVSEQNYWAVDGVRGFRLADFDFGLDLASLTDEGLADLAERFGTAGTDPLLAGITVTDLVNQSPILNDCVAGICGGTAWEQWQAPMPSTGNTKYYAGTEEYILDPRGVQSPVFTFGITPGSFTELGRIGTGEPGFDDTYTVPHSNYQPAADASPATPACTDDGCESTVLTKKDPETGQAVEVNGTGIQPEYINPSGEQQTNRHDLPPPATPIPPGTHPSTALAPTGGNGRDTFVFDASKVDFGGPGIWGEKLAYQDVVFRADGQVRNSDLTCGEALGGFSDGQVLGRTIDGTSPGYLAFDTGGHDVADFADCFAITDSFAKFGTEMPVFLDLPFAPAYEFSIEGPLFTSLVLPLNGAGLLQGLIDVLVFDVLADEYLKVGSIAAGETFLFGGDGVQRLRLTGLRLPGYFLDHDPSLDDPNPHLAIGFTLSQAGTVINAHASEFPSAVSEP